QFINSPDRQLDFSLRRGDPSVRRTATRPRGRLPGERDCVVVRRADAGGEVQLHLFAILTALTRATLRQHRRGACAAEGENGRGTQQELDAEPRPRAPAALAAQGRNCCCCLSLPVYFEVHITCPSGALVLSSP